MARVGDGVLTTIGADVGDGVLTGVGVLTGASVGFGVGAGVLMSGTGADVGEGVSIGAGVLVGALVGAGIGGFVFPEAGQGTQSVQSPQPRQIIPRPKSVERGIDRVASTVWTGSGERYQTGVTFLERSIFLAKLHF